MKKPFIHITTLTLAIALLLPFTPAICTPTEEGKNQTPQEENKEQEAETTQEAPSETIAPQQEDIKTGQLGKAQLLSPLLQESFRTDLATGAATVNIPIVVPPGRKNLQPNLALSYSSNNPNGICGVGWSLTTSSIQRSTKKGTPTYDDTKDTFIFSSSGSTGELVKIADNEYRQRIESTFMRYVYDGKKWTVYDKNGTKYTFGSTTDSRIENNERIFAWFLDTTEDIYGNTVTFTYEKDTSQLYLSKVEYTANSTQALLPDKTIEFLYEDRSLKGEDPDIIYNHRSGWKIATRWRLSEIHVKVDGALKWKYTLRYTRSNDTGRLLLSEVKLEDPSGNSLPPKRFAYQAID